MGYFAEGRQGKGKGLLGKGTYSLILEIRYFALATLVEVCTAFIMRFLTWADSDADTAFGWEEEDGDEDEDEDEDEPKGLRPPKDIVWESGDAFLRYGGGGEGVFDCLALFGGLSGL